MKTVHFFAFYLHNLPKITDFPPWTSMNLKNTKSLHFIVKGGGVLSYFQFSGSQSVLFRFLLSHFWDFTPAFMMIYPRIYDEVVQYRLNHHGYCFEFVSDADWSISLPRIQNFLARKIIVSSRENFMLNMRIHFILYQNTPHSRKECSWFSYWT